MSLLLQDRSPLGLYVRSSLGVRSPEINLCEFSSIGYGADFGATFSATWGAGDPDCGFSVSERPGSSSGVNMPQVWNFGNSGDQYFSLDALAGWWGELINDATGATITEGALEWCGWIDTIGTTTTKDIGVFRFGDILVLITETSGGLQYWSDTPHPAARLRLYERCCDVPICILTIDNLDPTGGGNRTITGKGFGRDFFGRINVMSGTFVGSAVTIVSWSDTEVTFTLHNEFANTYRIRNALANENTYLRVSP